MSGNTERPPRPAMPIKSRLPDDLSDAYAQAFQYARELEKVWAPKVNAYMDHLESARRYWRHLAWLYRESERLHRGGTRQRRVYDAPPEDVPAMTCERCGRRYSERFLIPHELWAKHVSPTGNDLGYFCILCTDKLLREKGLEPDWRALHIPPCPDCGGDGVSRCDNPDHGFIEAASGETSRFGCPVCGHDPEHRVEGEQCAACQGTGKATPPEDVKRPRRPTTEDCADPYDYMAQVADYSFDLDKYADAEHTARVEAEADTVVHLDRLRTLAADHEQLQEYATKANRERDELQAAQSEAELRCDEMRLDRGNLKSLIRIERRDRDERIVERNEARRERDELRGKARSRITELNRLLRKASGCLKDAHMEKRLRSDIDAAIGEKLATVGDSEVDQIMGQGETP